MLDGPLPHGQAIKIQAGGIFGLQQAIKHEDTANISNLIDKNLKFDNDKARPIENIYQVIRLALSKFGDFSALPYSEIVKSILHFELPKRTKRKKN